MKRLAHGLCGLAVLAVAGWALAEDKPPTIKEIMTKAHKGSTSLLMKLRQELDAGDPAWEPIEKQSKELVGLGKSLGKNKPPRGEKESWDKLTKQYVQN